MNYGIRALLFLSLAFVCGCKSKGFNRGELNAQLGVATPQYDDNAIKAAFAKKANLPKPFKLAVYYKTPVEINQTKAEWRWTDEDRALLEQALGDLTKDRQIVSEVFPLMNSLVANEDIKSIRLAASRYQADAVLIIGGVGQIDRYTNNWGWSYALLLPVFFVPGSESQTLFMTNASLWDVRNEFLYLTAESEATVPENYVAAFGKRDQELLGSAKSEALKKLATELQKMIKGSKI